MRARIAVIAAGLLLLLAAPVQAIQGAATAGFKGIWEPVSYPADITLTDVFFVTGEIGWVTGYSGTGTGGVILHTQDAGESWTVQHGDPESDDPMVGSLYFLDQTRGWAIQSSVNAGQLLYTEDGTNWTPVGTTSTWRRGTSYENAEYRFTSPRAGFDISGGGIRRTTDGGRNWDDVFKCEGKFEVDGLMTTVGCRMFAMHFPSESVGYAAGEAYGRAGGMTAIAKTGDGGETWTMISMVPVPARAKEVFFVDELTGIIALESSEGGMMVTKDGGETWRGIVAPRTDEIEFADPEVGWALGQSYGGKVSLTYTVNGGDRWTSRTLAFPADVLAFSIPRRDRAYVVGKRGMIYRYSVVPVSHVAAPRSINAPAMPGFASPLDDQVDDVTEIVEDLAEEVTGSDDSTASDSPSSAGDADDGFGESCCAESADKLKLLLGAIGATVPQFLSKYRNVNLVRVGLDLAATLPTQAGAVQAALAAFRQAEDKPAAQAALADLSEELDALRTATARAFQEPAVEEQPEEEEEPEVEEEAD